MKEKLAIAYNITTDPNFLDQQNAITPELSRILERLHELALVGKKSSVPKILNAIEKYPDNPQLKNYLSVLYSQIGDTKKMFETNQWMLSEHPNDLFGKLNLANEYYLKKEYHKMPEVLGEAMELKALYPKRDTFHLNEVVSFFKSAILYYTAIGDIKQAEIRYDMMTELAPDAADTKIAMNQIFMARMEAARKRFKEDEEKRIVVKTKKQETNTINKPPKFHHNEISLLYSHDLCISEEKIKTLLSLPGESLIKDLELVLQDSMDRYAFFSHLIEEEGWQQEKINFVVHAIYFLGELKSKNSIEAIIKVLSQSNEYLELYLGDFVTSMLWEPIYKMANQNIEVCKQFMFKPGIDTYAHSNFPDMLAQVVMHQPERRNEVLLWFKEVIQFFLDSKLEDNVIDSNFIGLLICNIIDIKGIELLDEIEQLFEKQIVSTGICGNWNEVKKAFNRPDTYNKKKDILPLAKRYEEITSTWAGYNEEERNLSHKNNDLYEPSVIPIRSEPKIGRNDPCTCGSGKKYKKCCLNT